MSWKREVEGIEARSELAKEQGGAEGVARQHEAGRLTIRERIDGLIDAESFREQGPIAGHSETDDQGQLKSFTPANYVLGFARIDGRSIVVGGEDFTQRGGSPSPAGFRKSVMAEELAVRYRLPLVRFLEGGGGSVPRPGSSSTPPRAVTIDSVNAPPRFLSVMQAMAQAPVASAGLGAVAGLPAARLVGSHFAVITKDTTQVMVGGPALVERALGKPITKAELGGSKIHRRTGVVDAVVADEPAAFEAIRRFLSYLPTNVWESAPRVECEDDPGVIRVTLKYMPDRTPVLQGITRISKPSLRIYVGSTEMKPVRSGLGTAILSTSEGVMTGKQARENKVGGEVLCEVW